MEADFDFSGYATKAGLKCSDGRTITPEAFKHMDKMTVPLVWQHGHNSPENILGHVVLEGRDDGIYSYGYFNDTPWGLAAKALVHHKDIRSLSIWANELREHASRVLHGMIREVSLVLSGANPGALIDFVNIAHSDGMSEVLEDEAIIYTGLEFENIAHADSDELTIQDVYDTFTQEQMNVVHYMIGAALDAQDATIQQSAVNDENETSTESAAKATTVAEGDLTHQEGNTGMTHNVFDQNGATKVEGERHILSHDAVRGIVESAKRNGSLKHAVQEYALAHGIENIDLLFPDAKSVTDRPEFDKRRTEWVGGVLNGTHHTPFSRIKSIVADLTLDEARAKGYVTGALKKEEFFSLTKRVTTPTTVYKKQKLDRDDVVDITDFDIVAWIKMEMRFMLDEELAISVLIGDGRAVDDEDKIKDPAGAAEGAGIRSIMNDHDLYSATVNVNILDASSSYREVIDQVIRSRRLFKGSGTPTFYTTELVISEMLLLRDEMGRREFKTLEELANELRVTSVVVVEAMEREPTLIGIIVNLADYTMGTDKGGEVNWFDDFDIDYNQLKYLIETRCSGALTKIRSALVLRSVAAGAALVVPVSPVQVDDEATVVNTTGVTYKVSAFTGLVTYNAAPVTVGATVTASFPIVLPDGASVTVEATPASASYYFANNVEDQWTFDYEA